MGGCVILPFYRLHDSLLWLGLCHLKYQQDATLPVEDHYMRYILDLGSESDLEQHEEDDPKVSEEPLRLILCMSKEGSKRLLRAHYIQSDIGFKRIIGFHEFELASRDRDANRSAYLTQLDYCAEGSSSYQVLCSVVCISINKQHALISYYSRRSRMSFYKIQERCLFGDTFIQAL